MSETGGSGLHDEMIEIARLKKTPGEQHLEQRKYTRYPYEARLAFVALEEDHSKSPPITVQGKDISAGGVCFLSTARLGAGERGGLLMVRSDGEQVVVGAEIDYCRANPAHDRQYICGLHFIDLPGAISLADFDEVVDQLAA